MSRLPSLVVFDCDGTLVDSHGAIVRTVQRAFAREGLAVPTDEAVRERVGLSMHAFVADLVGDLDPVRVEGLIAAYRDEYVRGRELEGDEPLFPGIRALLDELVARGVLLGVATGKSRRGLRSVIETHDLASLFVTLQTADDAPSKPHPAMVLQAIAEAGVSAHTTVVVGDSIHDVTAARAAGADAIGVSWGSHPGARLLDAGARVVVDDVVALSRELGMDEATRP